MFGDENARSALRVSTIGTPLVTSAFQSNAEWSVQITTQSTPLRSASASATASNECPASCSTGTYGSLYEMTAPRRPSRAMMSSAGDSRTSPTSFL